MTHIFAKLSITFWIGVSYIMAGFAAVPFLLLDAPTGRLGHFLEGVPVLLLGGGITCLIVLGMMIVRSNSNLDGKRREAVKAE